MEPTSRGLHSPAPLVQAPLPKGRQLSTDRAPVPLPFAIVMASGLKYLQEIRGPATLSVVPRPVLATAQPAVWGV